MLDSGRLLDDLLAHAPMAVIVHDRDIKIIRVNEAFHRMTGLGDEVLGRSPLEFIPEPMLSELGLKEKLPRVRDEGVVIGPEETRYRTPDGRPVVFWHKVFPVQGSDGAVTFVVTLLQDLTEHAATRETLEQTVDRQTELLKEAADTRKAMLFMLEDLNAGTAKIAQAKKEWEATFDAVTDPLFIHDMEFRIVRANRAYAEAAGMPLTEVIGRRYCEVFPKIEGPCAVCRNAGELQEEEEEEEEEVFVSSSAKTYRMWAYPLRDGTGGPLTIHIMEDITERKRAEDARREAHAQLQSILNGASDAIIAVDEHRRIIIFNRSAEAIFGYRADEVIGRLLEQLLPARFRAAHLTHVERFAAEAVSQRTMSERPVLLGLRKNGEEFPVEIAISKITLADRLIFTAIVRDVTERKRIETQARRLERLAAMGQLLGGIAHEMKNPLFILTGRLQLMSEKLANREYDQLGGDLRKIDDAARRMTAVTQRFLALSRPYEPRLESCAIDAEIRRTLDFLQNELMKNRIQVETAIAPDLPMIRADPMRLQEAFLNLIMNAMQAMSAAHGRGTLTVSAALVTDGGTRRHGDGAREEQRGGAETGRRGDGANWIEVRIQDDGPGIAPEHRAKLFEPFFTTKPPEQGTGLGLWTVRMIAMAMKGAVTCETEVGRGTTFVMSLPVAENSHQPSAISSQPEDANSGPSRLIAES